ncbi:MAG: DUF1847 domain-containing protein [Christensenellaceae bacterium]|nr:DUF1847 domain-containing protein [Christensenellaceae bacterium]
MHCDSCANERCKKTEGITPKNCPMQHEELIKKANDILLQEENAKFFRAAAQVEAEGYGRWSRIREIAELCKKLGYTRIGLGFCTGLKKEAQVFCKIMKEYYGIEVVSVMCKMGATQKEAFGISDSEKVRPGTVEMSCNPVGQALYLNKQKTPLNVSLGLCVGHDALFSKYSDAFVVVMAVKDRALAHNPMGVLYTERYCSRMLLED